MKRLLLVYIAFCALLLTSGYWLGVIKEHSRTEYYILEAMKANQTVVHIGASLNQKNAESIYLKEQNALLKKILAEYESNLNSYGQKLIMLEDENATLGFKVAIYRSMTDIELDVKAERVRP